MAPLRIIQWATGSIGKHIVQELLDGLPQAGVQLPGDEAERDLVRRPIRHLPKSHGSLQKHTPKQILIAPQSE